MRSLRTCTNYSSLVTLRMERWGEHTELSIIIVVAVAVIIIIRIRINNADDFLVAVKHSVCFWVWTVNNKVLYRSNKAVWTWRLVCVLYYLRPVLRPFDEGLRLVPELAPFVLGLISVSDRGLGVLFQHGLGPQLEGFHWTTSALSDLFNSMTVQLPASNTTENMTHC